MRAKLPTEQCWLILDALDNIDERGRPRLHDRLRGLEMQGWQCRIVLICRRANYDRAQVPWGTLTEYALAPFRPQEIRQCIEQVVEGTRRSDLYAHVFRDLAHRVRKENPPNNLPRSDRIFVGRITELM